jgi:hypothetical protein
MRAFAKGIALAGCFLCVQSVLAGTGASANYTSGPGTIDTYQYNFNLTNTGDTQISVFWYAWDDSGLNFLPSIPDNVQASDGWYGYPTESYGGGGYTYGIEWYDYGAPALMPGDTLSGFSFESNDTPDVLASISDVTPINPGDPPFPVSSSFVYMNFPAQQDGDPGFQFVATPAPEPTAVGLLALGTMSILARRAKRRQHMVQRLKP